MKLVVFSHKAVWKSDKSYTGYATDGGFAFHMAGLSEIFDETTVVVPENKVSKARGEVAFFGHHLKIYPVAPIMAENFKRKVLFPFWLLKNIFTIFNLIRKADAVHVPVPTDMGTIAMVMAHWMRKKLFVRHCGNWYVQVTRAEVFWKNFMEKNAGGRNVFMTTGGSDEAPSAKNPNIKWIFSTTLVNAEVKALNASRPIIDPQKPRLIIVCRQIKEKGTETVLDALSILKNDYPEIHFDIVGEGNYYDYLVSKTQSLGLNNHVTFHNKADHEKVLALLKQAHIFTFPTRASEGFPKALLEAMAAGLVVIGSKVSVIPELLKDGAGILLEEATPEALAAAVKWALENNSSLNAMQIKAQEVSKIYTLENWSKTIKSYLEDSWKVPTRTND